MRETDAVLYMKSIASYYGYFKDAYSIKEMSFKMKLSDKYQEYKKKYENVIVLMKEGLFYKTFYDDAKIIWYLFHYKYVKDAVSFGTMPYSKVIDKLDSLDIGYVVVIDDVEVLKNIKEKDEYQFYKMLSARNYQKTENISHIVENVKKILEKNPEYSKKVEEFLETLEKK